jgi:hypothetical protein
MGEPTGTTANDAVRVILQEAERVSKFRLVFSRTAAYVSRRRHSARSRYGIKKPSSALQRVGPVIEIQRSPVHAT